jgi:CDP-diacylglycerol--serine O-phosphatidyltransferase
MLDDPRPGEAQSENVTLRQLLPNAVTILGICSGLMSLRFVQAGRVDLAVMFILLAAVLDGLDGMLARRLDATSKMGAELDSLADFLNFGVAPAIVVFHAAMASAPPIVWVPVLVYSVCACLRLARFNIDRSRPETADRLHFVGQAGIIDPAAHPEAYALWLALVGLMMISRVPTLSTKSIRIPRARAKLVLIGVAVLMGLLITRFWLTMSLLALAYALILGRDIALWLRKSR